MKETQELKTRANNDTSIGGVRGGSEHSFGWSGSIQISSIGMVFGACIHWWK